MRRLALLVLLLLLAGCGGQRDGRAIFVRAQAGLARIHSGTIEVHAAVRTLIPIERTATLRADEVPLSKLELTRWTKRPHRLACAKQLECARADVDVKAALRNLEPRRAASSPEQFPSRSSLS